MTQQVHPAFIMVAQQSQQAWIMAAKSLSPLVQVMEQPSSVISHLHMPMTRLQVQTIIPFIIMLQESMPPASMVMRFCIIEPAILSSQEHVIVMPPGHFSILIVQRGTIIMFMPVGIAPGLPIIPEFMPGMPVVGAVMPIRSIIAFIIFVSFPVWDPASGARHRALTCSQYRDSRRMASIRIYKIYEGHHDLPGHVGHDSRGSTAIRKVLLVELDISSD
jgi:hypothetical protein